MFASGKEDGDTGRMPVPRFSLRQLAYFAAAARAGSISAAAEHEHVSRSAVAAAINELEELFSVPLASRSRGSGFTLTPTGEQVFELALSLLREADDLPGRATGAALTGSLTVGAFPSLVPTVFPLMFELLAAEHPQLRLDVRSFPQPELLSTLRAGDLDLAVAYNVHLEHDLDSRVMYDTVMHVIMPEEHPLASLDAVPAREVAKDRLILMSHPPGPDDTLAYFVRQGLSPQVWVRTGDFELMRSLVARGLGLALCIQAPRTQFSYEGKRLVCRPLDPPPNLERLSVVWPRSRRLSRAAAHVARLLQEHGETLAPRIEGGAIP